MSEETTTPPAGEDTTSSTDEQRVPYERFQQANRKAKEAAEKATALEQQMQDLKQQMEERDQAGLPELDQLRKRLEQTERKAQEAEQRASDYERKVSLGKSERWVSSAAAKAKFIDPDDAARYVDLEGIEDADQAERAVRRVAKAKPHLVQSDGPQLPGRVLENGRPVAGGGRQAPTGTAGQAMGLISTDEEATAVASALAAFRARSGKTSITFGGE